jgi:tRNA modification GTPase
MLKIEDEISKIEACFAQKLTTDLIVVHINSTLSYLGEITGEITTDELLGVVFGRFCIGK